SVFPPSSNSGFTKGVWGYPGTGPTDPDIRLHSFASLILPFAEANNVFDSIDYSVSSLDTANRTAASNVLPMYRCPSYSGGIFSKDSLYVSTVGYDKFAIRNYVTIGAKNVLGLSGAVPAEGVMHPQSATTFQQITDGTSKTLLLAETREENAAVWIDGTSAAVSARYMALVPPLYAGDSVSINYQPYFMPGVFPNSIGQNWGPSSQHAGGANHSLCDGSVRFLRDTIAVDTYDALSTRNGGDVVGAY
ncbi:MAG: DUF1559 domain-containing protein, partial [Planctomycetia bacterium]